MINLLSLYNYATIVTITPGPNNLMSMTSSSSKGYKNTTLFRLGIYTGFTLVMFITSFFNIVVSELLPSVLVYLKIIGALYIGYLILKINGIQLSKAKNKENRVSYTFKEGLLLQLVNPKVILYGISIFSSFIIEHTSSVVLLSLFSISFSTLAFLCINLWAIVGDKLQKYINDHLLIFRVVMSIGLLYSILAILEIA